MILPSRLKHSEDFTETSELKQAVARVIAASVKDLSQLYLLWARFLQTSA